MALTRSLSTGASSLKAHQQRFDVISNNLANLNTIAYKSNKAEFQEQFHQVLKYGVSPELNGENGFGGRNPMQVGLGVKVGSIRQDLSQGALESTNNPLDMALQGDGFFIYNQNGRDMYSRAGAISRDKDGFLMDTATGAYLQGYNIESDGNGRPVKDANGVNVLDGNKGNLQIPDSVISPPNQTESITMTGNLNAANTDGFEKKTSIKIFDNNGGDHNLQFTFTKTANPNEYTLSATIGGTAVTLPSTTVTFNSDGSLQSPQSLSITAANLNNALGTTVFDDTTPRDVTVTLADPNNPLSGLTGFSASNSATFLEQDGYESGNLLGLDVDSAGQVWGTFTNGQSEKLGRVLVAKFNNDEGLIRNGNNFYSPSPNSGNAIIGTLGDVFEGTTLQNNSLEQSNVDMTVQFTDMISTQRAYEAAARTITVSDQILGETTILKR
jgi:flagellar hook protein FlgE